MSVLFISGIDTDIGKTYATGMMAKALMQQGISVITQKLVQTGVSVNLASGKMNIADDIVTHRQLMGIPLQPCDLDFPLVCIVMKNPRRRIYLSSLPMLF